MYHSQFWTLVDHKKMVENTKMLLYPWLYRTFSKIPRENFLRVKAITFRKLYQILSPPKWFSTLPFASIIESFVMLDGIPIFYAPIARVSVERVSWSFNVKWRERGEFTLIGDTAVESEKESRIENERLI